jgi:hypothetical protein
LTGVFGLYLQTNNAHLIFDREEIEPDKLQKCASALASAVCSSK